MSATFKPISDSELQTMDLSTLQSYYDSVMRVVESDNSTIDSVQAVVSQYDYLMMNSQSTIDGVSYEILINSNLIIANDSRSNQLVESNIFLDKKITEYNSTITSYSAIIDQSDRTISSLMLESASLDSTLYRSDFIFNSTATYYSSLYMIYMANDQLYRNSLDNISTYSSLVVKASIEERESYRILQVSSAFTVAKRSELDILYQNSNAIQSTLTQYITNETNAVANLNSTNNGLINLSSLYTTAVVNQRYYQALSTQSRILEMNTDANSTYMTAKTLSDSDPTNTVKRAALTMATQRLSALVVNKTQSEAQVNSLKGLVADAATDTYAVSLKAAEDAIQLEINNVNKFQQYYDSSISAVLYFSTLYDKATIDIISSLRAVELYSTLTASSISGSNTLMNLAYTDELSIASQQAQVNTISMTISSLYNTYNSTVSSYNGWINFSSLMTQQINQANNELAVYSSFYESTSRVITQLDTKIQDIERSTSAISLNIKSQSSILESEIINMLTYQTMIGISFNLEELATYQYRETFVRQRRVALQQYYDASVLQQVQATSTQNGELRIQSAGARFTPIAINLNTPTVNLAYNNLMTVTTFLNTFNVIYDNYNAQSQNLYNISTSVGNQKELYSTLTTYSNQYQLAPTNPIIGQTFSNAQSNFISRQNTTKTLQSNVSLTQSQINTAKNTFLNTYQAVFLSLDIFSNESTISSFLIQGFQSARAV